MARGRKIKTFANCSFLFGLLKYLYDSMGVQTEDFKVLRWNILNHTIVAAVPQYVPCKIGLIPNRTSHLFTRSSRNLSRQR